MANITEFAHGPQIPGSLVYDGTDLLIPALDPAVKPDRAIILGTGAASSIALTRGVVVATDELGNKLRFKYKDIEEDSVVVTTSATSVARVVDIQAVAMATGGLISLSLFRHEGRQEYPYREDYSVDLGTTNTTAANVAAKIIAEINRDPKRIVTASEGASSTKVRLTSLKPGLGFTVTKGDGFTDETVITEQRAEFATGPTLKDIMPAGSYTTAQVATGKTYKVISLVAYEHIDLANAGFIGGRDGLQGAKALQPSSIWLLFDLATTESGTGSGTGTGAIPPSDFDKAISILTGAEPQAAYLSRLASSTPINA
ncbi:PDDEXK family nuclease [Spirosoma sordidisoli]|uniref:Uncharacterized protein n=1 Tax=Spirosoma sordidisoli TaxID=2502893 RepID=A0A4Q2ULN6_9BACT|nr:hypothetical protein [Spirosoma sordidisoli]RYC69642.1 hypothetical protein EQG79_13660 [Spirosoma sordidisoli]